MKNKIKILQIINDLNRGGAETLLLNICKGLLYNYEEFEFKVAILREKRYLEGDFVKSGVTVNCLYLDKKNPFRKIVALYNEIIKYSPDVVHTHLLFANRFGLFVAFLAGVKKRICTIHNMEKPRDFQGKLTRIMTSLFATHIITVSDSVKKFCVENKIYSARKMYRIYNAPGFSTTVKVPKEFDKSKSEIKLINVGRLSKQKGQMYLIRAMNQLKSMFSVTLDIYGEGEEENVLRNEIDTIKNEKIQLRGNSLHVDKILSNADIFISPSLWEGFNMSVVEAMNMGVPTILTSIPPHLELLKEIENYPLFVSPESSNDIVKAIKLLIDSPDLYKTISEQLIFQSKKFTILELITNYNNFYKSLL